MLIITITFDTSSNVQYQPLEMEGTIGYGTVKLHAKREAKSGGSATGKSVLLRAY